MKIDTSFLNNDPLKALDSLKANQSPKLINSNDKAFEGVLNAASSLFEETNAYQKKYDNLQTDFVSGKSDDLIALTMASTRASSSLQFTTQVTGKVVQAYQEIMRIQM